MLEPSAEDLIFGSAKNLRFDIVLTGGGTGGHLAIAKAVKEALNEDGVKPIFVGSTGGQDKAWFEADEGFSEKLFLNSSAVVGKGVLGKMQALGKIATATVKCIKLIKKQKLCSVLSVGGYSAAPMVFAAILLRVPLIIHEQNAVSGALNRIAKRYACAFFSSFDDSSPCTDYPVSKLFFDSARVRSEVGSVIFLGGSQGASAINRLALELAPSLKEKNIAITHQTGKNEYESVKQEYERLGIKADVFAFDKQIYKKIAAADFAVARSGASTLFELAANGLPAFFVPYPYAAGNHQYFNAKFLADKGLGFVKTQNEVTKEDILEAIKTVQIAKASNELHSRIKPEGAKKIAHFLQAVCNNYKNF